MSSSSGKGGSANQSKMVYGSGVIALSWGPWDWISAVLHNGNYLFQGSLALTTDVTDLTGAIADPSYLAPGGYLKLRRGTETQSADFTGRRNLGTVTLECRHLLFGQDTGTAPNLQVIGGGLPRVPTAIVAAVDNVADDGQVNPVACWAEILLDERGGNLPEAVFDAPSWLAAGNWAYVNRAFTFVSPMLIEQSPMRAIAKRLLDPFHGICYWTKAGKLACRVYEWGVDPGGLTTLDARHFHARPQIPLGDWDDVKTELVVSYTDRDYQFQGNTVAVPNALAAQIRQVDDQGQLPRPDVMRRPQAFRHGSEHNRRMGTAPSRATLPLRRAVLDALALEIGAKVKIDTDPEPGGSGTAQLCRIERIGWDRSEQAQLEVVTDNLVPATVYTPSYTPASPAADDAPPLVYFLGVPLPPSIFGLPRAVAMLATRPSADVVRFLVYFCNTSGGTYDELGIQSGFAVRAQLAAGIAAGDGTLQLTELDGLSGPDAEIAANTPGGNPTAAANNTLLALLCTLDGNGRIALAGNGNPVMEFVSIQARSFVSGATHSYTVLRGRLGTTAQAWSTGAVAWIVPREHLVEWRHELMDGLAGAPAFFRLVSATANAIDDTIPVPQCGVNMLPNSAPMVVAARPEGYYEPNLTNDRHTVASNAEGTALAGELGAGGRAWTDVQAFAASTGLTAVASAPGPGQFSFTAAVSTGTATLVKESNTRVRVETLTSLEAKILVTVNFEGTYTEDIEWIVWKNLSGGAYFLAQGVGVVKRNNAGAYTPPTVTFQALAKLSAAAPVPYAGRFKIAYYTEPSGPWVDDYVSASNESSKTYTPPAGIKRFRCQLYLAGSFSNFADEEEIPIVDDGTPGEAGAGLFTPVVDSGVTDHGGGSFSKASAGGAWDKQVYSQESFVNGAYVSFRPHQADKAFMVGLNNDPLANSSFDTIDYAFFCEADGSLDIYEGGSGVLYDISGGHDATTVLTIQYDGVNVRYLRNGTVVRTVAASANLKLHMDSSFYSNGARVNSVRFGPSGSKGDQGNPGAPGAPGSPGSPGANGATVLGVGGGGGTVNSASYADTSPPMLATFTSDGNQRIVQTSASQIVNASGGVQTVYAGLFIEGTMVAEWVDSLAAGESANFVLTGTAAVAAGSGKEARVKFKSNLGNAVAGGTTITVF